jgi:WXG100 family type VII secretion target
MTEIYVNYSGVENMEEALAQANAAISQILTDLQPTYTALENTWTGTSYNAYVNCQTACTNDMNSMGQILVTYNQTLSNMKENYFNTDRNLALAWEGITPS